jgi:hypothetical protein
VVKLVASDLNPRTEICSENGKRTSLENGLKSTVEMQTKHACELIVLEQDTAFDGNKSQFTPVQGRITLLAAPIFEGRRFAWKKPDDRR